MTSQRSFWHDAIHHFLQERISNTRQALQELHDGNTANSKSTAGDKHDTERAMVHMEMENLSKRLDNEQRLLHSLTEIRKLQPNTSTIEAGSVVDTQRGCFLLGVACGRVSINGQHITGISIQSPLGKLFLGQKTGMDIQLNGNNFTVQQIH